MKLEHRVLFQFEEDHDFPQYYRRCSKTGLYQYKLAKSRQYTESYFLEEYKNQYSKSYYEDEWALRSLAKHRLNLLRRFTPPQGKLLEIGCATGFFLDEARKEGFATKGVEISDAAASYGRQLGLDIWTGPIVEFTTNESFAVICAFFVLEHFSDLEAILGQLGALLLPGGLFFIGVPSAGGPTFRTNPEEWFKTHPSDHFYDFTPEAMKKTMLSMGLEMIHCSPMSYHKNRDKGIRGKMPEIIYKLLADLTCYGDTMHVIAKKK